MEADSTSSSSLQQKEMDDKSINEGSQISTSNQDNLSKIEEPQATQREVHEEGEKDVYETLRSDDQNVSKVAELTGEDSQSSQREDDISKEQETRSYESVHSDENLKDDITKAIPGKVTSVDNSIKDKVSEEAGEMSKVEKSPGANEMEGNDNIESKAENEPGSIAQEATITETSESENPTVESQQEHEAVSVADEVEDKEDSTKGAEPQITPSSDSQALGDVSADDATEMAVTDTGTSDANKVQEHEKMDTTGGESKQEDAERREKECEGKKNAEETEGEDNQMNQEEDTERQEEPIEPESTSEQKESITAAGDEEDGSKDKGPEDEKDQNGDEEEEAKLADEKEGEADGKGEDDEDEQEEEAEGKSERRRTSPIRCFDESSFTVEKLFEYQWPQDHGEFFFVQEQISEYLGVTSFKRKYPALERRLIAVEERRFLKDKGVVTEEQVTLGLTALKADEVYDVMQKDFPDKYSDYARLIQQRQREAVKNQHKEYGTPAVDSAKMKNYIKKAVRQAAEYNASLMREKREERQYYLDLQTMLIHCPNTKMKKLTKEQSKPGPYPVAVIPGQFQNYYKSYTPEELKYLPVNTAIYGPMATQKQSDIAPSVPPVARCHPTTKTSL
ncbi:putative transcription initiation factor TFIID subunit 3 [Apostichopus japonicus]|uniref:Putative transcription initiation factor TFIID subunit 3 n=1 Tax=Stichopus japonicus TaxID=307972 RepID=A0A2G8JI61_STIJA|nr:putative transcription initiation factor TFIID subunit 3 [Apostichopus japonicus]